MGREVKRVPLDFKWPLNQIWKGYWHPFHAMECKACSGTGENPAYKKLSDDWYGLENRSNRWCDNITEDEVKALWDEGRLSGFKEIPTAKEVNEWSRIGMGHDCINKWICVKQRAKRLGVSDDPCEFCKGNGSFYPTEEIARMSEEWVTFPPPEGDAYQLWETTSEGSPISPPFSSPEELAFWLSENNASTFASNTANYDTWLKFILGPAWAPSAIASGQGLVSGVDAAVKIDDL